MGKKPVFEARVCRNGYEVVHIRTGDALAWCPDEVDAAKVVAFFEAEVERGDLLMNSDMVEVDPGVWATPEFAKRLKSDEVIEYEVVERGDL